MVDAIVTVAMAAASVVCYFVIWVLLPYWAIGHLGVFVSHVLTGAYAFAFLVVCAYYDAPKFT